MKFRHIRCPYFINTYIKNNSINIIFERTKNSGLETAISLALNPFRPKGKLPNYKKEELLLCCQDKTS